MPRSAGFVLPGASSPSGTLRPEGLATPRLLPPIDSLWQELHELTPERGRLSRLGGAGGRNRRLRPRTVFHRAAPDPVAGEQRAALFRLPFAICGWAYSFPLAAMTLASFEMGARTGTAFHHTLAWLLLAVLTAVVALLSVKTLMAAARGNICVPE